MVANGPRPVDLTGAAFHKARSNADLAEIIRAGRGAMPPFADVLTSAQIEAVVSHVRTLERR